MPANNPNLYITALARFAAMHKISRSSICANTSNIKPNENTLEMFESVLNKFSAVEQGKQLLVQRRNDILAQIQNDIPKIIMKFSRKRLLRKLGFQDIDLSNMYFPKYTFQYTSSGGNSSFAYDIVMVFQIWRNLYNICLIPSSSRSLPQGSVHWWLRRCVNPLNSVTIILVKNVASVLRKSHTCCWRSTISSPSQKAVWPV